MLAITREYHVAAQFWFLNHVKQRDSIVPSRTDAGKRPKPPVAGVFVLPADARVRVKSGMLDMFAITFMNNTAEVGESETSHALVLSIEP